MFSIKAFGSNPGKEAKLRLKQSPHYKAGVFHNLSETPVMLPGNSFAGLLWKFLTKPKDTAPRSPLPSIKTDLQHFHSVEPAIIWFGHSSYLVHINGVNILVDPVFSGQPSPFPFGVKSFPGADAFAIIDLPPIDLLLITHDHYDHLDYPTILELKDKIPLVVTSLGVGAHFRYWGMNKSRLIEMDWGESHELPGGTHLTAVPARHFSGRSLKRGRSFWSAFILQSGPHKLYLGGDSGYDSHFSATGREHGPFDIALLECGQYNLQWPYIHMMPEQTARAAVELGAKLLLPVHWGKFPLSLHPWKEPLQRLQKEAAVLRLPLATPRIGEPVIIGQAIPLAAWWDF